MNFVLVFIGAGLGGMLRYFLTVLSPFGTLIANSWASFLMGFFYGVSLRGNSHIFFASGFAGGFSTFSTFSLEFFKLLQQRYFGRAALYFSYSTLLPLFFLLAGFISSNFFGRL